MSNPAIVSYVHVIIRLDEILNDCRLNRTGNDSV